MPLSTIDRGRSTGTLGPGGPGAGPPTYQRSRTIHTPPQTPPYHGTLVNNGHHGQLPKFPGAGGGGMGSKNGTLDGGMVVGGGMGGPAPPPTIHAGVGYVTLSIL